MNKHIINRIIEYFINNIDIFNQCIEQLDDSICYLGDERYYSMDDFDDVCYGMTPLEIAEKNGIWMIGYNVDNSERFPDTFLTAPVWNWEKFYEPRILECLQGKFQGIHYWEGVETGIVNLAALTENVKPGIEEKVEEERSRLMSGTFDVFYGPITDNEGNVRVKAGQSMTDDSMLNDFFWYVEGVIIDETE